MHPNRSCGFQQGDLLFRKNSGTCLQKWYHLSDRELHTLMNATSCCSAESLLENNDFSDWVRIFELKSFIYVQRQNNKRLGFDLTSINERCVMFFCWKSTGKQWFISESVVLNWRVLPIWKNWFWIKNLQRSLIGNASYILTYTSWKKLCSPPGYRKRFCGLQVPYNSSKSFPTPTIIYVLWNIRISAALSFTIELSLSYMRYR